MPFDGAGRMPTAVMMFDALLAFFEDLPLLDRAGLLMRPRRIAHFRHSSTSKLQASKRHQP
jgi:hypothetical protein